MRKVKAQSLLTEKLCIVIYVQFKYWYEFVLLVIIKYTELYCAYKIRNLQQIVMTISFIYIYIYIYSSEWDLIRSLFRNKLSNINEI